MVDPEDLSWLDDYRGLTADECWALAARQDRAIRVVRPGDIVTMEYRFGRVNVAVDDAGRVEAVTAG